MYSNISSLLCSYFHQTPPSLHRPDWERIFTLAKDHNILPIIYESARDLPEFQTADASLRASFLNGSISMVVRQQTRTELFLETYKALTDAGLKPLILKGLVCRMLYPQPDYRPSSDEDLWIAPSEFSLCDSVLKQCGYTCVKDHVTPSVLEAVQTINYETPHLTLEIHINPFGTTSGTHRAMNRIFSGAQKHPVSFSYQGQTLWTLSPTAHYLFLLVHLYKHFLSAGSGIRHLLDLCLFDTAYSASINRAAVEKAVKALHLETFYAGLLKIGKTFLGFHDLPQGRDVDIRPLLAEIMEAGCFGVQEEARRYSSAFTQASLRNDIPGGSLISILFPSVNRLRTQSPLLDRHPVLLPIFWVKRWRRIASNIFGENRFLLKSIRTGAARIRLFRLYKIRPMKETESHPASKSAKRRP